MPWARIDDNLYDHPKLLELGRYRLPCMGLYLVALSWSNRHLTDGYIPFDQVRHLGGTRALAERLVGSGYGTCWHTAIASTTSSTTTSRPRKCVSAATSCASWGSGAGVASGEARRKRGASQNRSGAVEQNAKPN